MTDLTPDQQRLLGQLESFRPENFRRTRWALIHDARELGLTWEQIGEALEISPPGANRMYSQGKKRLTLRLED